jgi:hypothetical protein
MELGALVPEALGAVAEFSEVLRGLGHNVIIELEVDATALN